MKKIVSICFLMIITLFSFSFVGCKENYTRENVNTLYEEVLTYVGDSSGFLTVGVDESKVKQTSTIEEDKAYIFSLCYDNFVCASGGLFFSVASRQGKDITYTLRDFTQEEINLTYEKLVAVRDASNVVASNKTVFETSSGNLCYRELVVSCNNLIEKLNDLNSSFSSLYFSHYSTSYVEGDLSNGELKDILSYGIQSLSFVSYNYELRNFEFSNPYGEVKTWYDGTSKLKSSNEKVVRTLSKIKASDLTTSLTSEKVNQIRIIIESIQMDREGYANEYKVYQKALDSVDIVKYFKATNENAYVQSLSAKEQSCFEIIDNFLNGRYVGLSSAINNIVSYL